MRLRHLIFLVLATLHVVTAVCWVEPAWADTKETARRHLKLGVSLFQERNYAGALVEFEASYRDLPSASALQNVALCQTKLFRYVDALETLEKLQRVHGKSLSAQDAKAVQDTMRELSQLVGTLRIRVTPKEARVTINAKPIASERLAKPVRLSSGEYRVRATSPDHAPAEEVVKVAGGEKKQVQLVLPPEKGEVTIQANDPDAAIAMDRQPLAYGSWKGLVSPGVHLIQIYKPGFVPYATEVSVRAGDKMDLRVPLGPRKSGAAPEPSPSSKYTVPPPPPLDVPHSGPEPPQEGWYGLLAASLMSAPIEPADFAHKQEGDKDSDISGGSFGVRLGWRFGKNVALEGMFDRGTQGVDGTYNDLPASYDLSALRYGANVRLMTGGKKVRLNGTFGAGGVWHKFKLTPSQEPPRDGAGTNAFFQAEIGPQFNVGQVLLEADVQIFFEGVNAIRDNAENKFYDTSTIVQVGVGLRAGFGKWGKW